jgi:hypothetical protein
MLVGCDGAAGGLFFARHIGEQASSILRKLYMEL